MTTKKDDTVAITLSGNVIKESGKIEKSDYFSFLRQNLSDYTDLAFTPEEAKRVSQHMQKLSTGAYAMVPLYCAGPACPFALRCPLQQMGKAPIGRQCLIEVQLLNHWVTQYMQEYDVDPSNFTEVGYCNELAEIEVMLYRLNISISKPEHAELVTDQTVGVGNDGTPMIQKQISPFMDQKEKLYNRRSRIIKLMVGDRQEKYKKEAALKQKSEDDPSSKMAEMRRKIESLQRGLNSIDVEKKLEKKPEEKPVVILTPDALIDSDE